MTRDDVERLIQEARVMEATRARDVQQAVEQERDRGRAALAALRERRTAPVRERDTLPADAWTHAR